MGEKFLDKVYGAKDAAATRDLYDDWAKSYEAEVAENGYATPGRAAKALAQTTTADTELLDFGCGTGLSGLAFRTAGFSNIDGMDLSAQMLDQAREKGVYRNVTQIEVDAPLPFAPGTYQSIAAVGVIGAGAAPLGLFDQLFEALAPGGLFVFSFNDHTLEDPRFDARVSETFLAGEAKIRHREYGAHLPGRDMKSLVYILEKL